MKKKLPIITVIIFLIAIFISLTFFINNLKKDSNQNLNTMEQIKEDYLSLEEVISQYNNTRTTLIDTLTNTYTQTFSQSYGDITTLLESIENNLVEAQELTTKLDQNCQDKLYNETTVNNICQNYQEYYEQLANIYLNDIKEVNDRIITYNNSSENKLKEYTSDLITDYLDYNQDGKYSERDE